MVNIGRFGIFFLMLLGLGSSALGNEQKELWTSSRLIGSPEPPLPYRWERIHPELNLSGAISLNRVPNSSCYLVLEQNGKIFHFDDTAAPASQIVVVDFNKTLPPSAVERIEKPDGSRDGYVNLFSCVFDPEFETNRYVYVCITSSNASGTKTHISRFDITSTSTPTIDASSELNILTCDGGGHNGCTLLFGPDHYLYISIGDLGDANPPDGRNTGQDVSDLYASILRIDVRDSNTQQPYKIPEDNPLRLVPGAAPEVYAFGLRNPFRMCFAPENGELWVGDVGWEAWEMIYRIKPGGNYGWSVKEGNGDAKSGLIGPTPILPPDIELPHSIAASITGGKFYEGRRFPELKGCYVFGDWVTRKFWSVKPYQSTKLELKDAAEGDVKPICFETDHEGELLVLDYNEGNQPSGIYRLISNHADSQGSQDFPQKLSETGLFVDVSENKLAPGVYRYEVRESMWVDGASAEYLVAVPNGEPALFFQQPVAMFNWYMTTVKLPKGGVLAKTYSIPIIEDSISRTKRIETQIALKDENGNLQHYTFAWNDENSDATLVGKDGTSRQISTPDSIAPEGQREIQWTFGARTQCKICHTPWAGETLGFIEAQLRSPLESNDSWRTLLETHVIALEPSQPAIPDQRYHGLTTSHDSSASLNDRARAYLHANCSHCHIRGGNASTSFDLRFEKSLAQTESVDEVPMRGGLGIDKAKLVSPGNPTESVLWLRMAKAGMGHMPQIGSDGIDHRGIQLISQWISSLDQDPQTRDQIDVLGVPSVSGISDEQRMAAAAELLTTPAGALKVAQALNSRAIVPWLRSAVVQSAMQTPGPMREVIEPFAPASLKLKRLGNDFAASDVLSISGDNVRGRELFQRGVGSCSSCHQIESIGKPFGPDLSKLSNASWTEADVLQQIMEPSLIINPQFKPRVVLTNDGDIIVGQVISETESQVELLDANGKIQSIALEDIDEQKEADLSLMPENLLSGLTAQQAADLLEYVLSLQDSSAAPE